MAIDIPDYLLPADGGKVEAPRVQPQGADLPDFKPEDFIAAGDEEEQERPDYRGHWLAAIEQIRSSDERHQLAHLALLGREERAARVVSVWPLIAPAFETPKEADPSGTADVVLTECWRKLWNPGVRAANPFILLLAGATGLSEADALAAAKMTVQARLILPDGTISIGAQRYVRIRAAEVMMAGQPRRPRDPKKPAGGAS